MLRNCGDWRLLIRLKLMAYDLTPFSVFVNYFDVIGKTYVTRCCKLFRENEIDRSVSEACDRRRSVRFSAYGYFLSKINTSKIYLFHIESLRYNNSYNKTNWALYRRNVHLKRRTQCYKASTSTDQHTRVGIHSI